MFHGFVLQLPFGGDLGSRRGRLARTLEALASRRDPTASPCASATAIIASLNVAFTCARRSGDVVFGAAKARARRRSGHLSGVRLGVHFIEAISFSRRSARLAGVRIGGRCRGIRTSTAQAAIELKIHQPLDVHRHLAAQIAFVAKFAVDHLAHAQHFIVVSSRTLAARRKTRRGCRSAGGLVRPML